VRLFADNSLLADLNNQSFASPKLRVINDDAFVWLKAQAALDARPRFDFVIIDFPDPSNYSIGKLYTLSFFRLLRGILAPGGAIVVQSTSPFVARLSYWCVVATLEAAGFATIPYHVYVPSFGEWGFVLASSAPLQSAEAYPPGLRYVSAATVTDMRRFPPDMDRVPTEINRLDSQALVRYFDKEWAEYGVN
jgi:spermidine synthase